MRSMGTTRFPSSGHRQEATFVGGFFRFLGCKMLAIKQSYYITGLIKAHMLGGQSIKDVVCIKELCIVKDCAKNNLEMR